MRERGNRLVQYIPDYTVFDLETTGISAHTDDIIEISAVKVRNGVVQDTFSTLVNPGRHIPAQATKVNGITDQMVSEAPLIREAMTEFLRFVGDFIDTLHMARKCVPELKHHRLTDLAEHFGISSKGAHRALNDCVMNQKCFEAMAKLQKKSVVFVCPKCGGEMIRRNGRYGEFWGCGNFPKCRYTQNG